MKSYLETELDKQLEILDLSDFDHKEVEIFEDFFLKYKKGKIKEELEKKIKKYIILNLVLLKNRLKNKEKNKEWEKMKIIILIIMKFL